MGSLSVLFVRPSAATKILLLNCQGNGNPYIQPYIVSSRNHKKQFEHQFVSDREKAEEGHRQTKTKSLIRCQSSHRIDRYLTGSAIFRRKEEWGLLYPLYAASQTLHKPLLSCFSSSKQYKRVGVGKINSETSKDGMSICNMYRRDWKCVDTTTT